MLDLLVKNARLPRSKRCCDIAIHEGYFSEIAPQIQAQATATIDAGGFLVSPPFVDSHFHLDSTLSYGQPRVNESGTLLEGITLWGELKPHLTMESIKDRAERLCRWAIARGTLVIRSHVDISDDRLLAVQALLEVRQKFAPWLDLQLVAFPQDGYLRYPNNRSNLARALSMGVDVIGGIPHFERTQAAGAASVTALCELAAERGLPVDMHCDETDDPWSRHIESLTFETRRLGLEGRVTGSHLASMHSMDNDYVSKLLPMMLEADIQVVANPLINITLQGRHDSYPKRRGMTRVKELLRSGINVSFGHDCVMDPWYSLGSHDMLEVAHMGLHVAQMTGAAEMVAMFDAVTVNGARTLGLKEYGLAVGKPADMVILQAKTVVDALRLRPARLFVIRRGKVISRTEAVTANLHLGEQEYSVDFMF